MTLCRHVSAIPLRAVLAVSSYGTSENSLKARAWPVMIIIELMSRPIQSACNPIHFKTRTAMDLETFRLEANRKPASVSGFQAMYER